MKEIGGYFGLEKNTGKEYHEGLFAVNSGRNALVYLLKLHHIRKLYIPYFLCDSVSNICEREGCPVEYYSINPDFTPKFDRDIEEGEWLYVVNYYGQISNETVKRMKKRWKSLIVDNVQAFFQKPLPGIDTVYSCRKFFGVPDGGYVAADAALDTPLTPDISKDRMKHILGRFEERASDYYMDFKTNDLAFQTLPLKGMSLLTHNLLSGIDYGSACKKRNQNYRQLHSALKSQNKLSLTEPIGPYCYPFYCENGMELKRKLAEKKIYVATLWPNVLDLDGTLEKDYAENILPLPCDQRYGEEDMERIIQEIKFLTEKQA